MKRKRPVVPVVDTEDVASEMREKFHDSKPRRKVRLAFEWPREFVFVGKGEGVMYHSDKWKTEDDYKHERESKKTKAEWDVYVSDLVDVSRQKLPRGRTYVVTDTMPKHVAYIGPFLGIQFYRLNGLPTHLELVKAHWAAARIPSTGETVLIAYASDGICVMVTGNELGIERDGIVG